MFKSYVATIDKTVVKMGERTYLTIQFTIDENVTGELAQGVKSDHNPGK